MSSHVWINEEHGETEAKINMALDLVETTQIAEDTAIIQIDNSAHMISDDFNSDLIAVEVFSEGTDIVPEGPEDQSVEIVPEKVLKAPDDAVLLP